MKSKKKHESSSESESSDSDSSSSSSDSSSSSSNNKKSHKSDARKKYSESETSGDESSKRPSKKTRRSSSPEQKSKKSNVEQSKWDSPVEKNQASKSNDYKKRTDEKYKSRSKDEGSKEQDGYRGNDKYKDQEKSRDVQKNRDQSKYKQVDTHRESFRQREHDKYREQDRYKDYSHDHDRSYSKDTKYQNKGRTFEGHYRNERNDNRNSSPVHRQQERRGNYQGRDRRQRERSHSISPRRERSRGNDKRDVQRDNRKQRSRSKSFDHVNAKWGQSDPNAKEKETEVQKEKPNFGLSGKLTEETNTYRGVVIKYSEPPEARKPKRRWRLYPFKGEKAMQTLFIHRQSAYLIGRDRKIADLPVDHPSCSKQHAVLQYRLVNFTRDDGSTGKRIRPYIIDLGSANGTFINNKKIDPKKYVELLEKDVIKFGYSSREYVMLHENSKDEGLDDDVKQEEEEADIKKEPID